MFIAMFGVRESLYVEIERSFGYYQADVNADFTQPYPIDRLQNELDGLSGIVSMEGWITVRGNVLRPDGETSDQVILYAPPADTRLVNPVMIEGRWLLPSDNNRIVVSNHFVDKRPDVKVGDTIQVRLNQVDTPFQVVGIFRMAGTFPSPFTYVPEDTLAGVMGTPGQVNSLRIVTDRHDQASQQAVLEAVQARFSTSGVEAGLQTGVSSSNNSARRLTS